MSVQANQEFIEDMRNSLLDIFNFVNNDSFQALLSDLYNTPLQEQPSFVAKILLNPKELEKRQIQVPSDLIIQRSTFGDGRPTLFCVTKHLKQEGKKVTFTF
jgi:hypothetical protein